ncbi:MAG: DUF4157 domain-containing protein [Candidatus Solibacter sp.]|nr:DUF4157 domain-containing protein [Candidatus Solibacter sp.]
MAMSSFMEAQFGHDFSRVRVHTDGPAAESARAVDALAYTAGCDVVFESGRYEPGTADGRRLLAHELTHVVQQSLGVHLKNGIGEPDDPYEQQADQVAEHAAQGDSVAAAILDRRIPAAASALSTPSPRPAAIPLQRQSGESRGYGVRHARWPSEEEETTRSEQAKYDYGMECLGTSVMYVIQSYGLVPPTMKREEFEYAFTPLKPKSCDSTKKAAITVAGKEVGQQVADKWIKAMPVDLFTKVLQPEGAPAINTSVGPATATEATLRGAERGGFDSSVVMARMPAILEAFKIQSQQPGYDFMKEYIPASGVSYQPKSGDNMPGSGWVECSKALKENVIKAAYFKAGNTVIAGVRYGTLGRGHFVVIVREAEQIKDLKQLGDEKRKKVDSAAQQGYAGLVYRADDPWYPSFQVYVVVGATFDILGPDEDGYVLYSLVPGSAYQRTNWE